jgi:hypothetical protein
MGAYQKVLDEKPGDVTKQSASRASTPILPNPWVFRVRISFAIVAIANK